MMIEIKDKFLSEEDLDLRNLTEEELFEYWNSLLQQAQITNDLDQYTYSYGVFTIEPLPEAHNTILNPFILKHIFRK